MKNTPTEVPISLRTTQSALLLFSATVFLEIRQRPFSKFHLLVTHTMSKVCYFTDGLKWRRGVSDRKIMSSVTLLKEGYHKIF